MDVGRSHLLEDVFGFSCENQFGFAHPVSERLNLGILYDFREAASSFSVETHEIVPYFSWQLSEHWSFTGLTSWGFTDASAEVSALGQLSYSW